MAQLLVEKSSQQPASLGKLNKQANQAAFVLLPKRKAAMITRRNYKISRSFCIPHC
jgi:hypothetical protein